MIKIIHRVNSISQMKSLDKNFGLEVDVRSYSKDLVVHHDPFVGKLKFKEWIKYYNHKILFVNIKDEGIEKDVINILKKNKIKNFVLFDLSFPFLYKYLISGENRLASRVSKYESINNTLMFPIKPNWIWIDLFEDSVPFSKKDYIKLKGFNFKLILVSPELHGRSEESIIKVQNILKKKEFKFDAVCTKYPNKW